MINNSSFIKLVVCTLYIWKLLQKGNHLLYTAFRGIYTESGSGNGFVQVYGIINTV